MQRLGMEEQFRYLGVQISTTGIVATVAMRIRMQTVVQMLKKLDRLAITRYHNMQATIASLIPAAFYGIEHSQPTDTKDTRRLTTHMATCLGAHRCVKRQTAEQCSEVLYRGL